MSASSSQDSTPASGSTNLVPTETVKFIGFMLDSAREGYALVAPLVIKAPDWSETAKMMAIGNKFLTIERDILKFLEDHSEFTPPGFAP